MKRTFIALLLLTAFAVAGNWSPRYPVVQDFEDSEIELLKRIAYTSGQAAGTSLPTGSASNTTRTDQGNLFAVPTATANGAEMPGRPAATDGIQLYVPTGATITYYLDTPSTAHVSPPINTVTITSTSAPAQIFLSPNRSAYVTATTGTQILGQYIQR